MRLSQIHRNFCCSPKMLNILKLQNPKENNSVWKMKVLNIINNSHKMW